MKLHQLKHYFFNLHKRKSKAGKLSLNPSKQTDEHPVNFYDDCIHGLVPAKELIHFSKSNNVMNRSDVAKATNCPGFLLEILANDEEDIVKFYVAGNLNTPVSTLELLGKDNSYAVRSHVMTNPNCPIGLRNKLMKDPDCEGLIAEIPGLTEKEIRKYFNMDYHTKEVMCFLQKIPDDMIQCILSGKDDRLIQNLRKNKQLKGHPLLTKKEG